MPSGTGYLAPNGVHRRGFVKASYRRVSLVLGALMLAGCDPKPTTGAIVVNITGLPTGAPADVRVTGPGDFEQTVPNTTTLENLQPGEYNVTIATVTHSNALFTSPLGQQKLNVTAGRTETSNVAYTITGGSIDLTITGLPLGIPPNVQLMGPAGFSRSVLTSGIQAGLPAGQYTIRSDTLFASDGDRYGTSAFIQTVTVPASTTPVPASIAYAVVSGTLNVTVEGLPGVQTPAPVTITGPGSFLRTTSVTASFKGLDAGTYTISAASTGNCPSMYTPSQASQTVTVTAGAPTSSAVTYSQASNNPANLNLRIESAYLVQVTQDFAGTVPMIAGKRALLRVFGNANQCNTAVPKVRVTLSNGTVFDGLTLGAGESSTRLTAEQGFLSASYNVELPAAVVQPGIGFFAEIDYDNTITEANETDNRFPASDFARPAVRTMTPTGLRFVPITVTLASLTGNITAARVDSFMDVSRRLLPVSSFDVDIREPLSTARQAFVANDQNGSWVGVLNELRTVQNVESNRYYYGVVKVTYNSGVAGIGFIGQKAALGWDFLPSASGVMAHELGHNFSSFHTPCGGPAGPDPNYPRTGFYVGGFAGTFGFDFTDGTVKNPQQYTDLMGYCSSQWISDFSYVKMMAWLTDPNRGATLPVVTSAAEQPSLLVWGRIINGEPVLEPVFEVSARPNITAVGAHRISAVGTDGRELFSVNFDGERIADVPGDQQTFSLIVPKSMLRGRDLGSIRLTTRTGRTATNVQSIDVASASGMTMTRVSPRAMRLRWDASRFPVVMVRNPRTGNILSFARGGDATIHTEQDELEMNYSNRVRSIRELKRLR